MKDWWLQQYINENYKTEGGESQKDVRNRFEEALEEVLEDHKGERIAVFSHGYAITFFIMKWCKFEYIEKEDNIRFTYKGKEIFNNKINAPDVFKLEFDENKELVNIEHIVFQDLPYKNGIES